MLPMIPTRKALIATITALSIALPAAPALAWGQREQDVLTGVTGALIIGAIINDVNRKRPQPQPPVVVDEPRPRHGHSHEDRGHEPRKHYVSVYDTAAAQAFNSYSRSERRLIQRRLANYGYYYGAVDGSFGPGTYNAVAAYARDNGQGRDLGSRAGAFGVYDGLIY